MLEDGRQIRDKGERFDEVTFEDVLKNHEILLAGVRDGAIRVCRPDNLEPLTLDQLGELIKRLAKDFKKDLKVDETLLEPLIGSDLKDEKVWVEKTTSATVPALDAPAQPPIDTAPASPKVEEPKATEGTGLLDDSGKEAKLGLPVPEEPEEKDPKKDPKHSAKKGRR